MKIRTGPTNEPTKKVNYFGVEVSIPVNADYLACDADGQLYAYMDEKPETLFYSKEWDNGEVSDVSGPICIMDLEEMDWKETLMEMKDD